MKIKLIIITLLILTACAPQQAQPTDLGCKLFGESKYGTQCCNACEDMNGIGMRYIEPLEFKAGRCICELNSTNVTEIDINGKY